MTIATRDTIAAMRAKSDAIEGAVSWVRSKADEMESALASLVEINSFTSNVEGGNRVGALLRALFERDALRCEVQKSAAFADHLVFRTAAPGQPIALVGHLDTVFPPGTFQGYRREGNLARGPGVLDMKGGLLVAGFALLALDQAGLLAELAIRFVIVGDEEVGSPEGQLILTHVAGDAVCGLVFEAGRAGDAIVTRRKGTGSILAVAKGRAAHAGNLHHQGVNAIWALSRFVDCAQALTDYDRGTTVNVGRITGGNARNTVPDAARADIDIRFSSREDGDALVAALGMAASAASASLPGASIELSGGISRTPLARSLASERLCAEYAACAKTAGLGSTEAPLVGGGSDANTLSALGVPCIDALGPRGSGFHTHEEQIEIATLVPKTEALVRFLSGRLPLA
ncbi:MAG TPA: M20 family metallopeptidase [Polyangiaceae bacterium]|jgi:glutamate carboxypeptidase|nr:M20 family metallopeptidase [Polyangiaceae bacterium]